MLSTESYWTNIINVIFSSYFSDLITTCIVRHKDYDLSPPSVINSNVVLHINPDKLNESFADDFYNFEQQDKRILSRGVYYDNWIKQFVAAIEHGKCEGFVVFQNDIPKFAATFRNASTYSHWKSERTKFLFVYAKELKTADYFEDMLFKNFANVLIIEADFLNSSKFSLKTNKFVGSLAEKAPDLIHLSSFDATTKNFTPEIQFFPANKLDNLEGREIIVSAFDYRPFVAIDYHSAPQFFDYADDNPRHLVHIDGTEVHILHTFCEIYNCTVQVNTSEKEEWGTIYPNYTGNGQMRMLTDGKAHIVVGAYYALNFLYVGIDHTTFLGRSGVTCLVPAPQRLTGWTLPLRPFSYTIWLAIIIFCLIETVAISIVRRFVQTISINENQKTKSCGVNFKYGYTMTLKLLVSQSLSFETNSVTLRTLLIGCFMTNIIITSIYGGGLAAILTLPILDEAADSVARLYRHNLTWTGSSSNWVASLNQVEDQEQDPIIAGLVSSFRVNSMDDMRLIAKSENMAFIVERLTFGHFGNGDFLTNESFSRLKIMIDDIYFQYTVALVARLWAHLPKYNEFILAWHSSGLSKYWEYKIAAKYMKAFEQERIKTSVLTRFDQGPQQLGLENFAGLIMLWVLGMLASVLVFIGERLVFRSNRRRKN